MISGRTHAQEFGAAYPQGSLRHAEGRAKFRHVQLWAMRGQRIFEPDHDIRVTSPNCIPSQPYIKGWPALAGNETNPCAGDNEKKAIRGRFSQPRSTWKRRKFNHVRRALKPPPPVTMRLTLASPIPVW